LLQRWAGRPRVVGPWAIRGMLMGDGEIACVAGPVINYGCCDIPV